MTRGIRLLGGLFAFIFAVTVPFLYLGLSAYALQESLWIETTGLAKAVEQIIQARPDMWEFEHVRLLEIVSQPSLVGGPEERTLRTAAGTVVVKTDFSASSPAITVSAALFDSGNPVGSIEARHSIRKQLFVMTLLGMLSSSLGYLLYFVFRTYPIRNLERALANLQRAEEGERRNREEAERLVREMATMADIGRLIGSTLEIDEVYERFAVEANKLIPFDRLAVNLHSPRDQNVRMAYVFGEAISGRNKGEVFPLKGSVSEVLAKTREGMYSYRTNDQERDQRFDNYAATVNEGLRSLMGVPLIYQDEVIGSLHFRTKKPNAYNERDLRMAERIGAQIAGAIANAQLYAGLKKTEQELKESEQRYRELSIVDDLTQLYNSRHFYFQLKIELDRSNRYGQPLTLLLLDLDNFKAFNDAYGHVEGDNVLWRLGQVVKRCLRETDFAFRYGGEEFTILLPMTTSADGAVIAERIRTEFKKETFSPGSGQDVHLTVSIGLAQYKPQEEMKAFVHRVDQLMYCGKKNGKDRVCSEPYE